jgi:ATP-binding protein involved in chromosome partitioning
MAVTIEQVLKALRVVQDPDLKRDLVALGFIKDVTIRDGRVAFKIELTTPACPVRDQMKEQARQAVEVLPDVSHVDITMTSQIRSSIPLQPSGGLIPTIKNVIPVASGKGGVGKSTVSANLAHALARSGARVGIMDADVYGPSIPTILGVSGQPEVDEQQRILPVEHDGLKVISMGFFVKPEEAIVWRGPMLHKTVQQFLGGVLWGELDYLIIDLPPGSGDVSLTLCQSIPITGATVVSTPQHVALNVAQKAIAMFKKLNVPILGIIENMSYYVTLDGRRDEIFGSGGARQLAERLQIPFLGEIPLATPIRVASDAGRPIVLTDPDSPWAKAFITAAENMAAQVSIRGMQGELTQQVKITF